MGKTTHLKTRPSSQGLHHNKQPVNSRREKTKQKRQTSEVDGNFTLVVVGTTGGADEYLVDPFSDEGRRLLCISEEFLLREVAVLPFAR